MNIFNFSESSSKTFPKKRLSGAGRRLLNKDLDDELITWIQARRQMKQRVSRRLIQQEALKIWEKSENDDENTEFKVVFNYNKRLKALKF